MGGGRGIIWKGALVFCVGSWPRGGGVEELKYCYFCVGVAPIKPEPLAVSRAEFIAGRTRAPILFAPAVFPGHGTTPASLPPIPISQHGVFQPGFVLTADRSLAVQGKSLTLGTTMVDGE